MSVRRCEPGAWRDAVVAVLDGGGRFAGAWASGRDGTLWWHAAFTGVAGELSAAIAHELNQPLTGIMTNCQAAQRLVQHRELTKDEMTDLFGDIVADARRAGEVIGHLRLMLRKAPREMVPLSINDTVKGAKDFFRKYGGNWPVIDDRDGSIAVDYGIISAPETFVVDGKGIIRYKYVGPLTPAVVSGELLPAIKAASAS